MACLHLIHTSPLMENSYGITMPSRRFRVVSPPSAPSLRPWLCAACKLMGEGDGTWARLRDHYQSFEAFNKAMRLKCLICTRLWARLYLEQAFTPSRDLRIRISYYFAIVSDGEGFTDHYALQFRFSSPDQTQPLDIGFSLLKDNTGTYDGTCEPRSVNILSAQKGELSPRLQRLDHSITSSTDSECTINLVQHWLSHCQANHPECNRNANAQYVLPLRVIDVGKIGDPSVYLSVSNLSLRYGNYITLSHCWGDADVLKLTTDNEMALRTGFAIKDLPKTFREAIQFTRALSVQYLWIDSLCIMQDSLEDWRHQSALMGEIYKNCFCNLAATGSSNSQGGIFVERDLNISRPFNMAIMAKSLDREIAHQGRYYVWDAGLWRNHMETAPLNRRGWVLQERLLAPRIIHFSKYVFWECKSLAASEIMPTGERYIEHLDHETSTRSSCCLWKRFLHRSTRLQIRK